MTDDASAKSQDFSALFRIARGPRQGEGRGGQAAKIGRGTMRKIGAGIYDGNYKGGAHSRLKNCAHVASGSISQRYVRARESRCVNRRETYRAPIIRGETDTGFHATYTRLFFLFLFYLLLEKFSMEKRAREKRDFEMTEGTRYIRC